MEANKGYGVTIERGEIIGAEDTGYLIASFSRHGLTTPPLAAINQSTYAVGDKVYFFMFDDGKGAILMKFE